ncbi:MAG: helix-turn-helix domain-containing protein [Kiritimatiellae bacterium]|nr:helix-turn-helix domain-containing protein [Kiritimatiellia bacterium]
MLNHTSNTNNLRGFESAPYPLSGHVHESIEISVFEYGSATMLYGGVTVTVPPNCLVVHWGMLPHQTLKLTSKTLVVGLHLPLTWVLQWNLPSPLLARLFGLDLFIDKPREKPYSDLYLLKDWVRLLKNKNNISREIVLHEVRARLLRLYQSQEDKKQQLPDTEAPQIFIKALQYISRNFRSPIRLDDIASAAGCTSRHLTRVFHKNTEKTVNIYITHLRLTYAMRSLVTTQRTIIDIMNDAGFSCTTQFYKAFRAQTGCTPHEYRNRLQK